MLERRNPDTVHAPRGYSHSVAVPAGATWIHISGQIGLRSDGTMVEDAHGQIDQTWDNLAAQLDAAGATRDDIVKITVFLTRREDVDYYRATRQRFFGDSVPASTLLFVAGLADPALVVEIEAVCIRTG